MNAPIDACWTPPGTLAAVHCDSWMPATPQSTKRTNHHQERSKARRRVGATAPAPGFLAPLSLLASVLLAASSRGFCTFARLRSQEEPTGHGRP